jgi:isopentenyldiphosphate isomerase
MLKHGPILAPELAYTGISPHDSSDSRGSGKMPDLGMTVDVVDERNQVVGVAERRSLFRKKFNFRTVDILLFDDAERLVLQRLPSDHLRNPGKLGASVAGYLLAGETYSEASARKLRSELNISADLTYFGEVTMLDEGCLKFIGVFLGKMLQAPSFDRDEIEKLVYMEPTKVWTEIRNSPEKITPTFLLVYEHFWRGQQNGRS